MGIRLILITLFFMTTSCIAKDIIIKKQNNLQNFALSNCLSKGFSDNNIKKEANAAAGAYVELGSYPVDAYQEASELATHFLDKKYSSKSGDNKLTVMKCIDLMRSDALREIEKKYHDK